MDQHTVNSYRFARTRDDLALSATETFVAGGTWLFSEPVPTIEGLVDLTTMGWPAWQRTDHGLSVAATCLLSDVAAMPQLVDESSWPALALFPQCCDALLASWKVWNVATIGGNVARAYAAGAMVSLLVTLDAEAVVWTPDGGERRSSIVDLVAGNGVTTLAPGEVLRSFELPEHALRATTALRKIALAEKGRSGAVVTARRDEDGSVLVVVTAATLTPGVLRFAAMPDESTLRLAVESLTDFYTDALGSADWRRAVSAHLAVEVAKELTP